MSFFENTRKPEGFGGKLMVAMMNVGHSAVARWGLQFLNAAPDTKVLDCGCGGGANMTAAEKMPAGCHQGHRLFARQRGEVQKGQRGRHRGGPLRRFARQRGGYDVC